MDYMTFNKVSDIEMMLRNLGNDDAEYLRERLEHVREYMTS